MPRSRSNSSTRSVRNPKQIAPAIHWFFTLNNYNNEDIEKILELVPKFHRYAFQEEIGEETGTPHLQGYIHFKKKCRPMGLFKWNKGFHWEKVRNVLAAREYCLKDDTRAGQQWTNLTEWERQYKGPNIDLKDWQRYIVNIVDQSPDPRLLYWIWEPEGNIGKTTLAQWIYHNREYVIVLSGSAKDMKNGVSQYRQKHYGVTPRVIILNIPRSIEAEELSYPGLESVKDMFFFSPKYEGDMVSSRRPHIFIFANEPPSQTKMSHDKWNVINVNELINDLKKWGKFMGEDKYKIENLSIE